MHMADVTKNFWGGHAIVGAHLPIAAGLALGDQYQATDGVTICMFGDGATNIGYFHEALNLSKVWNLPVLWVCENNQYGMGTAVERASAVSEIRQKAEGYGIPSDCVDGMDVLEVRKAAGEAMEYVRAGKGPFFLEIETYRFRGHSMGDPERYRKPEEVKCWEEENDPIGIYRKALARPEASPPRPNWTRWTRKRSRRFRRRSSSPKPAPSRRPKRCSRTSTPMHEVLRSHHDDHNEDEVNYGSNNDA